MPIAGTNIEVVTYRKGDDLVLLVNKGPCIFRTTLAGAFRDDLDPMQCNVLMRDDLLVLGDPRRHAGTRETTHALTRTAPPRSPIAGGVVL